MSAADPEFVADWGCDPPAVGRSGAFVLTTGRSGSTFLARTLQVHPELVVVSDLLEPAVADPYFDAGLVRDGAAFWDWLIRPALPQRIAYWRRQPSAELLYLPDDDGDVSLLMAYTLPFLADDPWELREELGAAVRARPAAPAPDHMLFLFGWLRDRFGGTMWVERTGGSLPHAAAIIRAWPDARYVELVRDPVETALSMRSGSFFRLCLAIEAGQQADWLAPRFAQAPALASMIERWSVRAAAALAEVPDERVLQVTYERLIEDPTSTLSAIAEFLLDRPATAVDLGWARARTADVDGAPTRAETLTPAERRAILDACPQAHRRWQELRHRGA